MKKILAMLMVSLILVCSMSIIPVSASYDIDVNDDGEFNVVVLGGYNVHHYTNDDTTNPWYRRVYGQMSADVVAYYGAENITCNLYLVGEEDDTSFEGAMVRAAEVLAYNPDFVIIDYSSDFRLSGTLVSSSANGKEYGGTSGTVVNFPTDNKLDTTGYIEKIILTFAESANPPCVWNIALPNSVSGGKDARAIQFGGSRHSATFTGFVDNSGVHKDPSSRSDTLGDLSDATCWDDNNDLTFTGHQTIGSNLVGVWKDTYTSKTEAGFKPCTFNNKTIRYGNTAVYGTFKPASMAVAEGFELQADGTMKSTAADATLTITLSGRTFGVAHDMSGANYQVKVAGANYVAVTSLDYPFFCRTLYQNKDYTIVVKADAPGVIIKGFYDSGIKISGAAYADSSVSATVLNSSLTSDDTAQAMVVYYDDNNKFVGYTPVTMTVTNRNKAAISAAAPQGATKAKIMVWKSLDSVIPMCDATDYIAIN